MLLDTRVNENSICDTQTHCAYFVKYTGNCVRGRDNVSQGDNHNKTHSSETFITFL